MNNNSQSQTARRERFDAKWTPEPNTGCFLWFGCREQGYGRIRVGQRKYLAHVLAWEWANGRSAKGYVVRHKCDTPACVNPDHLEIGSIADNVRDRDERGRAARGARHGSRLHPERLARGERNGMYRHPERCCARLYPERLARGERNGQSKLTENDVREIRRRLDTESGYSLARAYGVAEETIRKIKRGTTWKGVGR